MHRLQSTMIYCYLLARHEIRTCHTLSSSEIKVCIVGSGPAAFYTAQELLKKCDNVAVDIYECLPVPFGLVRYGVAPDHPEVKNCINGFTNLLRTKRCAFYGNVKVGDDISIQQLKSAYNAIVLAYGAEDNRKLGISGEDVPGCLAARQFVGWYNGLPNLKDLNPDLSSETAVVVGHGNVALDIARILLTPISALEKTDICEHALEAISKSSIKNIYLIGRRGPLQVAFTIKEFRELTKLETCRGHLSKSDFVNHDNVTMDSYLTSILLIIPEQDLPRQRRRLTELMIKAATSNIQEQQIKKSGSRNWFLKFLRSPTAILSSDDRSKVTGIELEINKLHGSGDTARAFGTGNFENLPCGLVISSIGYKSVPIDISVPFDRKKGIIPNLHGRILARDNDAICFADCPSERHYFIKGLYCSGWVKRGPVGVILNTMADAFETARCILEDLKGGSLTKENRGGFNEISDYLQLKDVQYVTFEDWLKIDAYEQNQGALKGKPREKNTSVANMLKIITKNTDC